MAEKCSGTSCKHEMLMWCPSCKKEQYGPAVWSISHGESPCAWCGHEEENLPRLYPGEVTVSLLQ